MLWRSLIEHPGKTFCELNHAIFENRFFHVLLSTKPLRYHTSEYVNETDYLGGVRVLVLRFHGLEPYTKFLVGMGKIKLPFGDGHGSFLAYAPGAGLDYTLSQNVTLRAIDFEYQHWLQFPYGSFSPYGISCGIRVGITPLARIPQSVRKRGVRSPSLDADSH